MPLFAATTRMAGSLLEDIFRINILKKENLSRFCLQPRHEAPNLKLAQSSDLSADFDINPRHTSHLFYQINWSSIKPPSPSLFVVPNLRYTFVVRGVISSGSGSLSWNRCEWGNSSMSKSPSELYCTKLACIMGGNGADPSKDSCMSGIGG
jgi:hypothetical protein